MKLPISILSLGPGDQGLIAIRSVAEICRTDIIFCPVTNGYSPASSFLKEMGIRQEKISYYSLPMNKNRAMAYEVYDNVIEKAISLRSKGRIVAIVAEGDAGFYSSTTYVANKLKQAKVEVKHVAGVPAFIAAAASIGLPVVEQEQRLTVCPGKVDEALFDRVEAGDEVAVVMKMSQCEEELKKQLQADRNLIFHYFEKVGMKGEFYTCDVQEILERNFPYFSLMIIKKR